jgi:hypothetical protein
MHKLVLQLFIQLQDGIQIVIHIKFILLRSTQWKQTRPGASPSKQEENN